MESATYCLLRPYFCLSHNLHVFLIYAKCILIIYTLFGNGNKLIVRYIIYKLLITLSIAAIDNVINIQYMTNLVYLVSLLSRL